MLPPDSIVLAATRWLRLLRDSTLGQAFTIIRADASYTDLTQTQYASGLEWLEAVDLLKNGPRGLELSPTVSELPEEQINQLLFERILMRAEPAWLPDADSLVPDPADLPQDAASLANSLGLSEQAAFLLVRHLHGRVDKTERARIGTAGERALVEFLERRWPGSTIHVALTDDGFGYDVLFRHQNAQWHLEVKTTTRRGRLVIYLSRHEHEVGLHDPYWRLIVVGLDDQLLLQAVATVRHSEVLSRAPCDLYTESKWQSASHQLTSKDLHRGLVLTGDNAAAPGFMAEFSNSTSNLPNAFVWMPKPNTTIAAD